MIIPFNCLNIIIDEITKKAQPGVAQIIYAGNGRYETLINEVLKKSGLYISRHMDNDASKHGMEVSEAFGSEYFNEILPLNERRKILIYSPEECVKLEGEKLFVIQSVNGKEIFSQLISMGVNENDILLFYKTSNEMMREVGFVDRIKGSRNKIELAQMQSLELELLHELDRFCKANNIEYFMNSGTLIGAARHKGFIPWDDDIDVYMTPSNYKKFMETYKDNDKYYAIDYKKNDDYFLTFGKLVNKETILFHPGFPRSGTLGIYIDIFVLAGYGDGTDIESFSKENGELENLWKDYFSARDLLGNQVRDIREEIMRRRYPYSYDESEYVGARHFLLHIKSWCVKKELFEGKEELFFEDGLFPAPKGWHELLTARYGDYMKLPPEEKRQAHLFDAYL